MRVPENYTKELEEHLSTITKLGYIPSKKNVKYLDIIRELSDYLAVNLNKISNALICCSADLNLQSKFPNLMILTEEDAECDSVIASKIDISKFDNIVIFSDWISGAKNLHSSFKFLNERIECSQGFYLIEQNHYRSDKLVEITCSGRVHKWFFYKQWKKINSSHMHLGYQKIDKPNSTLINLTLNY